MNTTTALIAIDPGLSGGVAVLHRDQTITAQPMPLAGKELDLITLATLVREVDPDWIVVERVGPMPKQGVVSTFKFGSGYGALLGIAAALQIPTELVTPQRWKGRVLHGTAKDKPAAIAYCRRVFPAIHLVPPRCRVPHDGIADALCLLEYGRRELTLTAVA